MLVGQFLPLLLAIYAARLNVPYVDRQFLFLDFDPGFLEDAFEEGSLPPPNVLPNGVMLDEFLQFCLRAISILEVISQRQDHEHFGIIGI